MPKGHSNRGLDFIEKHPLVAAGALLTAGASLAIALVITAGSGVTPAQRIVKQTPNGTSAGAGNPVLVLGTSSGGQLWYCDEIGNCSQSGSLTIGGALTIDGGTAIGSGTVLQETAGVGTISGETIPLIAAGYRTVYFSLSAGTSAASTGTTVNGSALRMDFDGQVSDVYAQASADGSGVTIDLNKNGTSIFSTRLTTDTKEVSSSGATTPHVYGAGTLKTFNRNDLITVDLDTCGDTSLGATCPSVLKLRVTLSGSTFYPR